MTVEPMHKRLLTLWGKNVRDERDAQNHMSQTTLAKLAGYTQPTISEIERGVHALPLEVCLRVASALNVDPQKLFPWPLGCVDVTRHEYGMDRPEGEAAA